eukprot:UN14972
MRKSKKDASTDSDLGASAQTLVLRRMRNPLFSRLRIIMMARKSRYFISPRHTPNSSFLRTFLHQKVLINFLIFSENFMSTLKSYFSTFGNFAKTLRIENFQIWIYKTLKI